MTRRLIEEAFPLKKVSEDSKHEKNVRHGHISTLHIWPARRPLAACRAAIIAALLPDPGDEKKREEYCRRIENITRWKSENGPDLQFFRDEIRKAFGGRAPKVLDMFAGGGAIPLEAMRLGCDVTAIDYNPVAWFILKCTLEFPQKLAGKKWPLPNSQILVDRRSRAKGANSKSQKTDSQPAISNQQSAMDLGTHEADLAAHVRYWGKWVLERARTELAPYYPVVDGKPTVAYLWARTAPCQDPKCGTTVPLLKTLWLCKKENKRRALRLKPDGETRKVAFEIWEPGPKDEVPHGTMSGAKSRCPVCGSLLTPDYIKDCGKTGKMGAQMTAVVVETPNGKEYRLPTPEEEEAARRAADALPAAAAQIPYGLPNEPINPTRPSPNTRGLSAVTRFGITTFTRLFAHRQLLSQMDFIQQTCQARVAMEKVGYPEEWIEAIESYLAILIDRLADYNSTACTWHNSGEKMRNTFPRFALSMTWDFAELNPFSDSSGCYAGHLEWVTRYIEYALSALDHSQVSIVCGSSTTLQLDRTLDAIITDPPYYDAIPYSDLSDFFYVWLRRVLGAWYGSELGQLLSPKRDELIQHVGRFDGDNQRAKKFYEDGMAVAFQRAYAALKPEGAMVVVFAHKEPEAWETLVSAMIRAGFVVTASWPIDTEMVNRSGALGSASLSSSVWMVFRKRPADAGTGRYVEVKRQMQERITERLRYFWDQGISGPDFVWAAVGPALESYSSYREVRRMDGSPFTVSEFLREVRRLVTDFALGRILHGASTEGLDEWTRYYLMHRSSFGLAAAPVGECILLAQGYGLDLNELKGARGFIAKGKPKKAADEENGDESAENAEEEGRKGGGSDIRLLSFDERKRDDLGEPHPSGGLPIIDMLHRLMRLWQAGDTEKLTTYIQQHGLSQNELFWAVAQAVLEMADPKTKERTLLEALVAWGRGKRQPQAIQASFQTEIPGAE